MNREIKCPNCGTLIRIDESDYNHILEQVRSEEFDKEIKAREKDLEERFRSANERKEMKAEADFREKLQEKENEVRELKSVLRQKESENRLAISEALSKKDREISELSLKIETLNNQHLGEKDLLKQEYEGKLRMARDEVNYYKDFKARQSTKLVGESLEVHCSTEFGKLRPLFPNASFGKDNEISKESGSKGDFIYRDYEDGVEFISIMFEMKNERDETLTKKKNEDFLKELDKDRREKNCEYAVLVTLLEPESELYNSGIVDVSYRYPKMYVIRPQFFIPIITMLRNAALSTVAYRKQVLTLREQNLDITHFEENMNAFKDAFSKNYELASRRFVEAIEEIDKTIDHLEKVKKALQSSENNLRLANNKAQDLSIKKLTKNAPSVAERFEEFKGRE